jgi:hypothetical protein
VADGVHQDRVVRWYTTRSLTEGYRRLVAQEDYTLPVTGAHCERWLSLDVPSDSGAYAVASFVEYVTMRWGL